MELAHELLVYLHRRLILFLSHSFAWHWKESGEKRFGELLYRRLVIFSKIIPRKTHDQPQCRPVIALLLWQKKKWKNTRKTQILGILQGLVPFGGRAWETVDQLLVDVGSRTITQWHCMCESAGGIRESHVFVESTLPRVAAKDEGKGGRTEGTRGVTFSGKSSRDFIRVRTRDATLLSR